MNASVIKLHEEVDVRLLANLSENFRSSNEAAFEIIDNALAASLENKPTVVTVTRSAQAGSLKFIAKGGRGMGAGDLNDFLRWGKKPGEVGLNRYGQGGKAAIGYLGTGCRVHANAQGEDIAYEFEDHDWLSRPDGKEKTFDALPVPARFPGEGLVEVEIFGLRRQVSFKKLEREVAWRYRPALSAGTLKIRIKGKTVTPVALDAEVRHEVNEQLSLDGGESVTLRGWVGVAPPKFEERGGVRCSTTGRVVAQNEYFGHRTASFKASLNRLVGEVDLSFVPVLLNKNAFDQGSSAWMAAQEVMHREMQPFVERLLQSKETAEPSDAERERAMEARDVAHRALEKIAAETARRGQGGQLGGRKPPEPRAERSTPDQQQEHATTERKPRTPPPPHAVGRLRRKGIDLDWDLRALDPKLRSARSVDGDRTEIIINSQFPLYRERGGDMPYMLETGLLEELQPTGENEKTVEEYIREVTDALHEALVVLAGSAKRSGSKRAA